MAWSKSTTTKHTCGGPAFGRLTTGCPRCDELANGAEPVRWNITDKRAEEERFRRALKAHTCKRSGCSIVCTFGDW